MECKYSVNDHETWTQWSVGQLPFVNFPLHVINTTNDQWKSIGDRITENEYNCPTMANNKQWIVIRIDINNMSKQRQWMIKNNKMSSGYCNKFSQSMKDTLEYLCIKFNAKIGFTQSDEMTLVLNKTDDINFQHQFKGRRDKLITLIASSASVKLSMLVDFPLQFDGRASFHDTYNSARQVIAWRKWDATRNGVSDAVYHLVTDNNRKSVIKMNTYDKLKYMYEHKLLEQVIPSQFSGFMFIRKTMTKQAVNLQTGVPVECIRSIITEINSNDFYIN